MATDNLTIDEVNTANPLTAAKGDIIATSRSNVDGGILTEDISKLGIKSVIDGITAFATGGQANAVELTTSINELSVVGSAGDSVKLDAAVAAESKRRTILNNGANAADVFPPSSGNLGAGVDTAVSLAAGANITYESYNTVNWFAVT